MLGISQSYIAGWKSGSLTACGMRCCGCCNAEMATTISQKDALQVMLQCVFHLAKEPKVLLTKRLRSDPRLAALDTL